MDKKTLKEIINSDLYRYYGDNSSESFLKIFRKFPEFRYTYYLRKCSFYREQDLKIRYYFFHLFLKRMNKKYWCDIRPTCNIGRGFYIGHLFRVRFHQDVELGCNVNIGPGVTIASTYRGKNKGIPKIGNEVWIGTEAFIAGKIQIGNNVLIAPKAYVNFDIPDNAVVLGNPGKIISYQGTEGYIRQKVK
jgi:serine O-acetyltransferase